MGSIRYGTGSVPVVESQAECPAGGRSLERPAQTRRRDVMAGSVEDRDREDVEAGELTGACEAHLAVRVDAAGCHDSRRAASSRCVFLDGWSTVKKCSARLMPNRIDSLPKLVVRVTPFARRCQFPLPALRDAEPDRRGADVCLEPAVGRPRGTSASPSDARAKRRRSASRVRDRRTSVGCEGEPDRGTAAPATRIAPQTSTAETAMRNLRAGAACGLE